MHFRFGQEVDKIEKRAGGLEVDIRKGPEGSSVVKRYQAYQVIEAMGYQVPAHATDCVAMQQCGRLQLHCLLCLPASR